MDPIALDERIASLYGEVDWGGCAGVIQVAAIASPINRIIALGPAAPRSPTDRFVLGLARARADAILTTGSILRGEPKLVHQYAEDLEEDAALAEWRRRVMGRSDPPALIVLSGSGNFPLDHPALSASKSGFIWTSRAGRDRIRRGDLDYSIEVEPEAVTRSGTGVAAAIEAAKRDLSAQTISIEAGPSTAATLYSEDSTAPFGIDELLLSHFEGELQPPAMGPPFISADVIASYFDAPVSSQRVEESSGSWRFERSRAFLNA
jgi:riboflavin biosynthesis pyrimidine reductase